MGFLRGEICYEAEVSGCACWRRLDKVNYCGRRRGEEGTSLLGIFPVCIEGGDATHFLFCIENGVSGVDLMNEVDFADLYFPLLYWGRKY